MNLFGFLGLPVSMSVHGPQVDKLMYYVHYLMLALFVGWFGYFIYALFRFRKSSNPKASYVGAKSHASSYVEIAVALVECVLLIGFAVPLWGGLVDKFPEEKDATVIRVAAEQFAWNSRYSGKDGIFGKQDVKFISTANPLGLDAADPNGKDDVVTPLNEMIAPLGKPVITYFTSKDVIHSFKVVPFRVTQDCIPGLSIPIWFQPTKVGDYLINCAQLCGNSHYFMKGIFKVVTPEAYEVYMAEKSKGGGAAVSFE